MQNQNIDEKTRSEMFELMKLAISQNVDKAENLMRSWAVYTKSGNIPEIVNIKNEIVQPPVPQQIITEQVVDLSPSSINDDDQLDFFGGVITQQAKTKRIPSAQDKSRKHYDEEDILDIYVLTKFFTIPETADLVQRTPKAIREAIRTKKLEKYGISKIEDIKKRV